MEPPPRERRPAGWLWAAAAAIALVAVTAGAVVAILAGDDGPEPESTPALSLPTSEAAQVDEPPPSLPVTVPIPPAIDPTVPLEPAPPAEVPPAPAPPAPVTEPAPEDAARTWPAGRSGYTVVLASVPEARGRAAAEDVAAKAAAAGLPRTGVLRSADFSSLRQGFWVAFSGVYSTPQEAREAVAAAARAGFASAYARDVTP